MSMRLKEFKHCIKLYAKRHNISKKHARQNHRLEAMREYRQTSR